jgi:LmbE family N-acetylglucosaminyl deacetylase
VKLSKRLIVFSPHPDDETLGCGGTIAKKISENYEVTIVVMTDGRLAFSSVLGINSNPTPEELKSIRKEEVIRAAAILGVPRRNLVFFDFEDRTLKEHEKEAEAKVKSIFEANPPAEIYFPYEKDCHMDHQATNRIVSHSVKHLKDSTLEYQYSIVQRFTCLGPKIVGWSLQNRLSDNLVQIDISEFLPLKKAAIKEFKSQLTILSDKQKRPVLTEIDRYLGKREAFFVNRRKSKRALVILDKLAGFERNRCDKE